ncbi:hypothetical protein, partial [Photorhabdus sp. MH8.4]
MSCCPGLIIPSVNIPFCCYLTTQGDSTGTLRIIFRWFNRKGGRRRLTWKQLELILKMLGYPSRWKTHSMFNS